MDIFDIEGIRISSPHKSPFRHRTSGGGGRHPPRAAPRHVQKSSSFNEPCVTTSNRPQCSIPILPFSAQAIDSGSSLKLTGRVRHYNLTVQTHVRHVNIIILKSGCAVWN